MTWYGCVCESVMCLHRCIHMQICTQRGQRSTLVVPPLLLSPSLRQELMGLARLTGLHSPQPLHWVTTLCHCIQGELGI